MKKKSAEDIQVLEDIFKIKSFNYINITQKEQLEKIIKRWPLIAEFEKNKSMRKKI